MCWDHLSETKASTINSQVMQYFIFKHTLTNTLLKRDILRHNMKTKSIIAAKPVLHIIHSLVCVFLEVLVYWWVWSSRRSEVTWYMLQLSSAPTCFIFTALKYVPPCCHEWNSAFCPCSCCSHRRPFFYWSRCLFLRRPRLQVKAFKLPQKDLNASLQCS